MSFVIDASVAIKWFVREKGHEEARRLLEKPETLHAPDLLVPELTNVAWKKAMRGEIGRDHAVAIARVIRSGALMLYSSALFHERALELAFALDHPVYDCIYLACAEALGGTFITADLAFVEAAKRAGLTAQLQPLSSVP